LSEIEQALQALPKEKAPGADGLPTEFLVGLWDSMKDDLLAVYKEALEVSYLCRDLNTGILCLLPKGGNKILIKNWRPITLLGTVYKLLAKTMVRRLQPMLGQLIRPNQTGFLKGRSIIDNVFLAFEMMD
jgi:hypothetical protein